MKGRCQINKPKTRPKVRKQAWQRNADHLRFIRLMNCCVCGGRPSQAAHVRSGTDGAAARKPSDRYTVPLCQSCHIDDQHRIGEAKFWAKVDGDPLDLAAKLWGLSRKYEGSDLLMHGAYAIRQWRQKSNPDTEEDRP